MKRYKEFFLEQIRTYPNIRSTNLYYKTEEAFLDFKCTRERFFKYIKKLREDYGFDVNSSRKTTPRKEPLPGDEAQVDFGQCKMKDMYGRKANSKQSDIKTVKKYNGHSRVRLPNNKPTNKLENNMTEGHFI